MLRAGALVLVVLAGCASEDDGHPGVCQVPCPQGATWMGLYLGDLRIVDANDASVHVWIDGRSAGARVPLPLEPAVLAEAPLVGRFNASVETETTSDGAPNYSITVNVPFGVGSVYAAIVETASGAIALSGTWEATQHYEERFCKQCIVDQLTPLP